METIKNETLTEILKKIADVIKREINYESDILYLKSYRKEFLSNCFRQIVNLEDLKQAPQETIRVFYNVDTCQCESLKLESLYGFNRHKFQINYFVIFKTQETRYFVDYDKTTCGIFKLNIDNDYKCNPLCLSEDPIFLSKNPTRPIIHFKDFINNICEFLNNHKIYMYQYMYHIKMNDHISKSAKKLVESHGLEFDKNYLFEV